MRPKTITVIDAVEQYGLGFHAGTSFALLAHPKPSKDDVAMAYKYLKRWFDDPYDVAEPLDASDEALAWASPQAIIKALGMKGNIAIAATYILTAAEFADDERAEKKEIAKALGALELAMQEVAA